MVCAVSALTTSWHLGLSFICQVKKNNNNKKRVNQTPISKPFTVTTLLQTILQPFIKKKKLMALWNSLIDTFITAKFWRLLYMAVNICNEKDVHQGSFLHAGELRCCFVSARHLRAVDVTTVAHLSQMHRPAVHIQIPFRACSFLMFSFLINK